MFKLLSKPKNMIFKIRMIMYKLKQEYVNISIYITYQFISCVSKHIVSSENFTNILFGWLLPVV